MGQFSAQTNSDRFDCTKSDLIRLGRTAEPSLSDDRAALVHGATQFKVNFNSLREALEQNAWAHANILVAIAGGQTDGTSGLRQAADQTIRQELEKFADIIFASSAAQREFWLGQKSLTAEQLQQRYGGCKPCMHGSDAHDLETIGKPVDQRYTWIKGALSFDGLRQACIDPEGRAYVGAQPPKGAMPSQVITHVTVNPAPWLGTTEIPLNSGLVAIIGARGSGKTALADMIAAGCDAISDEARHSESEISPSFLARARPLIGKAQILLTWGSDEKVARYLDGRDYNSASAVPRARYLSQQFVEELCSSKGASEGLVREIERVIYEAHAIRGDEGAYSFEQLREQRTFRHRQTRRMESEALAALSDRIAVEFEKEASVGALAAQVTSKEKLIIGYSADLSKLIIKGGEAHVQRYSQLSEAAQTLTTRCNAMASQRRTFVAMQDEVANTRTTKAPEMLRQVVDRHPASGLSSQQWNEFLLVYQGNVDKALTDYIVWADQETANMLGDPVTDVDPNISLIALDADLSNVRMSLLKAEMTRLEKLISADKLVRDQYTTLSRKIATERASLQQLHTRWNDAKSANERRKSLQIERDATYGRLMAAIIEEQKELADLYVPLMERISTMYGTLKKLGFRVSRTADVAQWARTGEESLIDCRKSGDFYGRGSLEKIARAQLQSAWEGGSAEDVQATLGKFWGDYSKAFLAHAPVAPTEQEAFRKWSLLFAHWLFSTDHIAVKYEILYEGVDIRKLSPGTRGIVLLLLYLALDDVDDRPLIIDQPEENLDPKSVFDELVSLFIAAKGKRQVIIVTHNANLVINTDADQIIIANASPAEHGGLPSFTYISGGMEDANIRKTVCEILEGGEIAFKERARRLRVRFGR